MALGIGRAGVPGAVAAWVGFTAPSAMAMILFAYGVQAWSGTLQGGVLHGLKVVAVAVVAQAVWAMARSLCPDAPRATLAVLAAIAMLLWQSALGQIAVIAVGATAGLMFLRQDAVAGGAAVPIRLGRRTAAFAWVLFVGLAVALPVAAGLWPSVELAILDRFYRTGWLVFGGGHVVLPLLQAEVVPPGWVTNDSFLAGYGAAQAVPGPLFTFAAYLGAVMQVGLGGWLGGLLCLVAVFLPSFLLVAGALPLWQRLHANAAARSALAGINAAVVGLLLAALYDPVWVSAIRSGTDFALALAAFLLLAVWRVSPWIVVVTTAAVAAILS
jgi:chromate transporter